MHTMSHANNDRASAGNDTTIVERVATAADTSTTVTIVRAVAEAESVTPGELPVLADVIDPESLEGLFDSDPAVGRSGVRLSFEYCGYVVEVTDELVTLRK
ncbi:HalOD1 output domain-containing protein [Halorubrum sp. Eb13]|uniref:HalOD1 output domain-containing protein n=1 Tax=Halorubrum sp. Eb13 TaxID=1383843 RepID=UPI0020CD3826|nr:HalOD1 output domain-containing protein [Halorubrum sp. Eb13]